MKRVESGGSQGAIDSPDAETRSKVKANLFNATTVGAFESEGHDDSKGDLNNVVVLNRGVSRSGGSRATGRAHMT